MLGSLKSYIFCLHPSLSFFLLFFVEPEKESRGMEDESVPFFVGSITRSATEKQGKERRRSYRLRIAGGSRSADANSSPKTFTMYNSSCGSWLASAYTRYYACSRDNDTMFAVTEGCVPICLYRPLAYVFRGVTRDSLSNVPAPIYKFVVDTRFGCFKL